MKLSLLHALLISIAPAAALVTGVSAQQPDPGTGFGAQRIGPNNIQGAVANDAALGIVELNGEYFVSARGALGVPPHKVFVLDAAGRFVRVFNQSQQSNSNSVWGYRDGATDGTRVAFGYEDGIEIINANNGTVAGTFHGQSITSPIAIAGNPLGTHRGVAFNPAGNGGNGSFWVGDFGANIYEITLQGNILRQLAPPAGGWWVYGLAIDANGTASAADDSLWVSSAPNEGDIRELDLGTGQWTGASIRRNQATSAQGGLDGVGSNVLGGTGSFGLVALDQGDLNDSFSIYRVDRDSQNPGQNEGILLAGVGGGPTSNDRTRYFWFMPSTWEMDWDTSGDPALLGRPGVFVINAGPGPLPDLQYPGFPELVPLLFPAIFLSTVVGVPVSFPIPAMGLSSGDQIRVQTAYFEPRLRDNQLAMSNQVFWERREIVVMADGLDSFNSDTSRGFWSVTNYGNDPITEITLDWAASTAPGKSSYVFDTNESAMADRFDAGNSTTPGCSGTYRNNSHITSGLIFDGQNTVLGVPCNPSSNCGWIGTNQSGPNGSYRTLRFRFTPGPFENGVRFEFDCDVDVSTPGAQIGASDMGGLIVTIRTRAGRTFGPVQLFSQPGQARSLVGF
ncbi:MAG: hypothetical protein AAF628_21630 [Planctomycetota bacterium]